MKELKKASKLTYINVNNNQIGDEGFGKFLFSLQLCQNLTHISAANNQIGFPSYRYLAGFVDECYWVKIIDISGLPLCQEEGQFFSTLGDAAECQIKITIDSSIDKEAEACLQLLPVITEVLVTLFKMHHLENPYV